MFSLFLLQAPIVLFIRCFNARCLCVLEGRKGGKEGAKQGEEERGREGGEETLYMNPFIVTCVSSIKLNHRYCSKYMHKFQQMYARLLFLQPNANAAMCFSSIPLHPYSPRVFFCFFFFWGGGGGGGDFICPSLGYLELPDFKNACYHSQFIIPPPISAPNSPYD